MKSLLTIIFIPLILHSTLIDKVIYNGIENSKSIFLNSDIKRGEELDISKIDTLAENFKYVKNNNIDIKIEPSDNEGMSNIVINNKKTNPFKLSISLDNHGKNIEEGKYRYTINTGLEGLILNEKLDISYTFITPKLPNKIFKKDIDELLPGEELEETKDKRFARRNENLNINLSFPIKNNKIYLIYSNSIYLKSLFTENDNRYDVSGVSNKYEIKIDRKVNRYINLNLGYYHIDRKSYVEDVKNAHDKINNISIGFNTRIKEKHKLNLKFNNKVINKKYIPSFNMEYKYKEMIDISNIIEYGKLNTDMSLNLKYRSIYSNIGFSTDYKYFSPNIKLGVNFNISRLNIDSCLEYNQVFRALFAIKFDIIK
ncbi:ShlB/FhaC/HecB family hemolysin secretion/activation protein [Streptobacillus moniliformis]|uniref:ShlB/FhaC/HecB family hemolysin secretion/activation protein n=1 Tax=Streptobacillus moniliformis TaxID=34105 RepID=UPI0007E3E48C|nr:ShlB/FhaC/HecB family hemolysin secretion/activation protein [Streptobacillus moniliformis]